MSDLSTRAGRLGIRLPGSPPPPATARPERRATPRPPSPPIYREARLSQSDIVELRKRVDEAARPLTLQALFWLFTNPKGSR